MEKGRPNAAPLHNAEPAGPSSRNAALTCPVSFSFTTQHALQ
jgi:hypothetical protein